MPFAAFGTGPAFACILYDQSNDFFFSHLFDGAYNLSGIVLLGRLHQFRQLGLMTATCKRAFKVLLRMALTCLPEVEIKVGARIE